MTHPHLGLRQQLVAELRRQGHIRSGLVAEAFTTVPRHLFAPQVSPEEAYANQVVPLKQAGQHMISTLSQPAMMAIMLEALELQPGMSVLEIGAGSGYNAALLQQIVGPTGRIVSVDVEADLVEQARQQLSAAGYGTVQVEAGDGGLGFARQAPYDRIIATAAADDIPPAWWRQLAATGRLAMPLILVANLQIFVTFVRHGEEMISTEISPTAFIRLRGTHEGNGFKRTTVGPGQGIFIRFGKPPSPSPEMLYEQLIGKQHAHPLQVRLTTWELQTALLPWLLLQEPGLVYLQARKPVGPFVPDLLYERDAQIKSTLLLPGPNGSAALARREGVGDKLRKSFAAEAQQTFHLQIQRFGADSDTASRLAGLVNAWAQHGRPTVRQMQMRAQQQVTAGDGPAGWLTIDRPTTRFWLRWATS